MHAVFTYHENQSLLLDLLFIYYIFIYSMIISTFLFHPPQNIDNYVALFCNTCFSFCNCQKSCLYPQSSSSLIFVFLLLFFFCSTILSCKKYTYKKLSISSIFFITYYFCIRIFFTR